MEFLVLLIVTLGATLFAVSVTTVILRVLFHLMEGSLVKVAHGHAGGPLTVPNSVNG
jgi:hypothetical protein